jgi:hypothetical protein
MMKSGILKLSLTETSFELIKAGIERWLAEIQERLKSEGLTDDDRADCANDQFKYQCTLTSLQDSYDAAKMKDANSSEIEFETNLSSLRTYYSAVSAMASHCRKCLEQCELTDEHRESYSRSYDACSVLYATLKQTYDQCLLALVSSNP